MSDIDDRISKEIKEALDKEMSESAMDINVDSRDNFVTLSGMVDTLAEKRAAEEIATLINEIKGIENNITISTDGTITDKEVESEVINKLRRSRFEGKLTGVSATVSGGTAVLKGSVETLRYKKLAVNETEKALGVKDIVSNLSIESEGKYDDASIDNELSRQFHKESLSIPDIVSNVHGGVVHLSGHVDTRHDMELAVEIAEGIEGVTKVVNMINLRH
jgi:osmotically-inducible protein OsmY